MLKKIEKAWKKSQSDRKVQIALINAKVDIQNVKFLGTIAEIIIATKTVENDRLESKKQL